IGETRFELKSAALSSNYNDNPSASGRMFHKFVSAGDLDERNSLGDLETRPTGFQCSTQVPRGCDLRIFWEVVTAEKKQSDILEHHQPEWNCGRSDIRRIGCDRSPHFQQIDISCDVRSECHLDDMIDSIRSQRLQSRRQFMIVPYDLVGSRLAGRFFLRTRHYSPNHMRSGSSR